MLRRTFMGAAAALCPVDRRGLRAGAARTLYWISHGSPADPVLDLFPRGRGKVGRGYRPHRQHLVPLGRRCRATRKPCARPSRPARTRSVPRTPPWCAGGHRGRGPKRGYPHAELQHPRSQRGLERPRSAATSWRWAAVAQYLVDNGHVEEGDFVWMPVEVPGATYGVQGKRGSRPSSSRWDHLGEVTDATPRPGRDHQPQ